MKIGVLCESQTGNTLEVAKSIADEVASLHYGVYFMTADEAEDVSLLPKVDFMFVCSWVDRTTWAPKIRPLISQLPCNDLAIVATAGWVKGDYPNKIFDKMKEALPEKTKVHGTFICQGKMRESTRERYLSGKDWQHASTPEMIEIKVKNWDEALSHPDDEDLANARRFAQETLERFSSSK